MIVNALELDFFRNYTHLEASFDPLVNLIYGDNAQGKTNLLEAVAYLSAARSHRARYDREMIMMGIDSAFLKGEVASRDRVFTLEAKLVRGRGRQLFSNGVRLKTAGELADSARSRWEDFTLPATPESARTAHGQPSPPAYARTDSYTPSFPLQFPLPGQSRKTSGYGWRTDPMGGLGDDFHIGNDLAAAQGTPVLAAADGVVRMAGSHKSYGNYLRILHADGDETLYAHMQYLFVKAGECVTAGQILGTVGETGNATGPHLHFEILHRGLRYDPAEALQNAS